MRSSFEFYLHVRCSDDFTEESTNLNVNANANVKPDMGNFAFGIKLDPVRVQTFMYMHYWKAP